MLEGKSAGLSMDCEFYGDAVEGRLLGGNLSLLAHLCGSTWAPDYSESICILEDVGERPYALDRYLTQLLSQEGSKTLSSASAIVLGEFSRCEEANDPSQDTVAILKERLSVAGLRVGQGLPLGHGSINRAFPFGAWAWLSNEGLLLAEAATDSRG